MPAVPKRMSIVLSYICMPFDNIVIFVNVAQDKTFSL